MAQVQYRVTYAVSQQGREVERTTLVSAYSPSDARSKFQKSNPGIYPSKVEVDSVHELIRVVTTIIAAAHPKLKQGASLIGSAAANVSDAVRDNKHLSIDDIVTAAKRTIGL